MRRSGMALAIFALLVASACDPALARGGSGRGGHASSGTRASHAHTGRVAPNRGFVSRTRVGVFVGAPVYAAPYFYAPPGYYPPPPPVQYIERQHGDPQYVEPVPDSHSWYFCPESGAYYPYVQQCPGGWEKVAAQPPASGY